jgi:hypothetical protein
MDLYQIDVSGKIYKIDKKLLLTIPYFANMIKDSDNNDKYIFVQRSSLVFDHVYAYVIDKLHPYPIEYYYELDFYGIEYEKDKLYDTNTSVNNRLTKMENYMMLSSNANVNIYDNAKLISTGRQYICRVNNCKKSIQPGNLYCDDHKDYNKCVVTDCGLTAKNYNYCDKHIIDKNNWHCSYKSCRNQMVPNKGYCFLHFTKNT